MPAQGALGDRAWQSGASCRLLPPELFFPAGRTGRALEQADAAKAVCRGCPVAGACLRYALETNQEYGIWGGTTEDERRALRRHLARAGASDAGSGEPARGAAS